MRADNESLWRELESQRVEAEKLADSRSALAERLVKQTDESWNAGELTPRDLLDRYITLRDNYLPGLDRQWLEALPGITYERLVQTVDGPVAGTGEEWSGTWPMSPGDDLVPQRSRPVAYVLRDRPGRAAYVGSTNCFLSRMRSHERVGKDVATWWAIACRDDTEARATEQRLINEYMPYLNRLQTVNAHVSKLRPVEAPAPRHSEDDEVGVDGYYRYRFGRREFVRTHRRNPRSKSEGGYKKRASID